MSYRKSRQCTNAATCWIIAPALFLSCFAVFWHAPAQVRSSANNLLFFLSSPDSPLNAYPVPLTAGVIPKRFHSHNDYEQNVPLYKALSYGASSVEADIYLVDGELLVGHTPFDLSKERTLASLYLDPLISLIQTANEQVTTGTRRGIFELAPSMTLNLLIDIKTDGASTFEKLYTALEPLRSAGYLSTYDPHRSSIKQSVITVIGTGNTPLSSVQALGSNKRRPRDIFLDAPLAKLPGDTAKVYNHTNSPLASIDFGSGVGLWWALPPVGKAKIRMLVEAAHTRGVQARFWNTPIAPVWLRNYVWQMLLDEGVDWLNVDDLPAARDF